jgi:hypothetical protein
MEKLDESRVLERIKKLLSLATSSNENEARAAAEKVSELLIKYNLDMQEVTSKKEYSEASIDYGVRMKLEDKYILPLIARHFFVRVIIDYEWRPGHGRAQVYKIYGLKHNVEIAGYVHDVLSTQFKQLFNWYKFQNPGIRASRDSFYFGLAQGFSQKLDDAKTKVEGSTGLVVTGRDEGLEAFIKQKYPHMSNRRISNTVRDHAAYAQGTEYGSKIVIHKGVKTTGEAGLRLGGGN